MSASVKVQRFVLSFGASEDVLDHTLPTPVAALDRAFARITNVVFASNGKAGGESTNRNNRDLGATCFLSSVGNLRLERDTNGVNHDVSVFVEVIECLTDGSDTDWRVRYHNIVTLGGGTATHTQAISGVVDRTKCIPIVTGICSNQGNRTFDRHLTTAKVSTTADEVELARGDSTGQTKVSLAVLEFTGSGYSVHPFSHSFSAAGANESATVASVGNWDNAVIFSSKRVGDGFAGLDESGWCVWPGASSTEVKCRLRAGAGGPATHQLEGYVLSHPRLSAQHLNSIDGGQTSFDNLSTALDTDSRTLSSPVNDLTQSSIVASATCAGTGTAYPRQCWGYRLQNTSTIEFQRARGGQAGNWAASVWEWPELSTVERIGDWAHAKNGHSHPAPAGENRLLVVFGQTTGGASGEFTSVTYGGRSLTRVNWGRNVGTWAALAELWILDEAEIQFASDDQLSATGNSFPTSGYALSSVFYSGVDQNSPIYSHAASATNSNPITSVALSSTDLSVFIMGAVTERQVTTYSSSSLSIGAAGWHDAVFSTSDWSYVAGEATSFAPTAQGEFTADIGGDEHAWVAATLRVHGDSSAQSLEAAGPQTITDSGQPDFGTSVALEASGAVATSLVSTPEVLPGPVQLSPTSAISTAIPAAVAIVTTVSLSISGPQNSLSASAFELEAGIVDLKVSGPNSSLVALGTDVVPATLPLAVVGSTAGVHVSDPAVEPGVLAFTPTGVDTDGLPGQPAVQAGRLDFSPITADASLGFGQPEIFVGPRGLEPSGVSLTSGTGAPEIKQLQTVLDVVSHQAAATTGAPGVLAGLRTFEPAPSQLTSQSAQPEIETLTLPLELAPPAANSVVGAPDILTGTKACSIVGPTENIQPGVPDFQVGQVSISTAGPGFSLSSGSLELELKPVAFFILGQSCDVLPGQCDFVSHPRRAPVGSIRVAQAKKRARARVRVRKGLNEDIQVAPRPVKIKVAQQKGRARTQIKKIKVKIL